MVCLCSLLPELSNKQASTPFPPGVYPPLLAFVTGKPKPGFPHIADKFDWKKGGFMCEKLVCASFE